MRIQNHNQNSQINFGVGLEYGKYLRKLKSEGIVPDLRISEFESLEKKVQDLAPTNRTIFLDAQKLTIKSNGKDYFSYMVKPFDDIEHYARYCSSDDSINTEKAFLDQELPSSDLFTEIKKLASYLEDIYKLDMYKSRGSS